MVAAGRPYRIRPQARWRFRSIHHPAGRNGPAQADELQGQRRTSGVVAGWRESHLLQHADGLQGRSAIHVRAATLWRPVRDAERRNAGGATDRQSVGRCRPELAGAEKLTPGARWSLVAAPSVTGARAASSLSDLAQRAGLGRIGALI